MAYVGGKARKADHILSILNHPNFDGMDYLEPFIGYGHILRRVHNKKKYAASDVNSTLITLLKGVKQGKTFPVISKREYERLKPQKNDKSFRRAVAAFAYSFKGMEWIGYFNECKERNSMYAQEHKRYYEKLHENEIFQKANLMNIDYRAIKPTAKLIYCDPPYQSTTKYNQGADFNHDEFWNTMREWSKDNIVFISEYRAPSDFKCIAKCAKYNNLAPWANPDLRCERVFAHQSILPKIQFVLHKPSTSYRGIKSSRKKMRRTKRTSRTKKRMKRPTTKRRTMRTKKRATTRMKKRTKKPAKTRTKKRTKKRTKRRTATRTKRRTTTRRKT
jgi:DNA adenine methylase